MSKNKVSLDFLIESLSQESRLVFEESPGLKWEWEHYCKLESLITKIREKESQRDNSIVSDLILDKEDISPPSFGNDEERRLKNIPGFIQWLRDNEVNAEKVKVSYIDQTIGFGLTTISSLKSGEVVFTIPKKVIITSALARQSKLAILSERDPILSGMQNVLLAIFLIYERFVNLDSFWKPYLKIMPLKFDTILYFSKEEMKVLKNSPSAFREALRMLRNVARQYAYFHSIFRKATDSASRGLRGVFTYNRYIWGVSAVTTRVNHLPSTNKDSILSLIPLWDLCNHEESEVICTDYNDENETLTCYAGHEYDENTEFTIYYGRRSSGDFLVHNGFVPQNYRHDFYNLELGIGMNDVNYNRKKAILGKFALNCQSSFSLKPEHLTNAKSLFVFVRVFQADKDYVAELEEKIDDLKFLEEPTPEVWKYLTARFLILKKASENSLAATIKNLYGDKQNEEKDLSRVTKILLQLLKNEQKVLEMLYSCASSKVK